MLRPVMNLPQSNLFSFAFIDPSMLLATMTLKYGKHFDEGEVVDCRRINLRSQDGVDLPILTCRRWCGVARITIVAGVARGRNPECRSTGDPRDA
jgi:hypothetical protein